MKITSSPASVGLKVTHNIVAVGLLAVTLSLLAITFSTDGSKMPLYLTSTFYTTYYTNQPTNAWTQPTDQSVGVADTFYGCLQVAGVGADPPAKCADLSPADYATCLNTATTSGAYILQRFVDAMSAMQSLYPTPTASQTAVANQVNSMLPKPLGDGKVVDLDLQLGLIKTYLESVDSPFARRLYDAAESSMQWRGVAGCIDGLDATAAPQSPLAPAYDRLWQCASGVLPTTRDQALAYQECVPLSAWPALDELQSVYSPFFLGSYNRLFLLIVAAWVITSFAVFTLWFGDSQTNNSGKPLELLGRTGILLAGFCALWNAVGATVLVSAASFQGGDKQNGLAMTLQTLLVSGLVVVLASAYFLQEFWEQMFTGPNEGYSSPLRAGPKNRYEFRGIPLAPLAGYARVQNSKEPLSDEQSAPLLVAPWSDVWLLTDGLLFLGVVGTSPDVVTAEVGRVFLAVTYAAAAHTAFVRLLYEGRFSEAATESQKGPANASAATSDATGIRIMAYFAQMAILGFVGVTAWLVFPRYAQSGLIVSFVVLTLIIPPLLWFILSLCVEYQVWPSLSITTITQVAFIYHALIRVAFIAVVLTTATADADNNATLRSLIAALEG